MERIRAKVVLGLPLTDKEKAIYLLFIATDDEAHAYMRGEQ